MIDAVSALRSLALGGVSLHFILWHLQIDRPICRARNVVRGEIGWFTAMASLRNIQAVLNPEVEVFHLNWRHSSENLVAVAAFSFCNFFCLK